MPAFDRRARRAGAALPSAALPLLAAALLLVCLRTPAAEVSAGAVRDFGNHCAACHGADRLGATGPALMPESLERLSRSAAEEVVAHGRLATQMPAFGDKFDAPAIRALVDYIYSAPVVRPEWGAAQIRASRIENAKAGSLPDKPVFAADPLNLFVVVESGDHHATILDGDTFEPLKRFATRYALHGGPKFSPDGRYVYFASRDGWVSKYDIWNLTLVAEVRAGINTRNLAVSGDGRFVMVGNTLPRTVVLLDAVDLSLLQVIEATDSAGRSSRVSAVYDATPRASFIVALKDVPEIWEVPYAATLTPSPLPRAGEGGAPSHGADQFPVRRIALDDVLDDFFLDPACDHLIGAARGGREGQVVDLNAGRRVAVVDLPGLPHLGSGISWQMDGRPVLATPNLKEGLVTVIDMQDWKTIAQIKTAGAGFFLRSHENTPYAWVDAFNSVHKDTLQIIDKRSLQVVGAVTPSPGHTVAHVEFTRDGRYALASLWEMDGALIVYDAATFKEVKRLPMVKPSGKYNVYNKTTRSTGTSH